MIIIGVDYHPSFQTIAFLMEETGEYGEQELNHSNGEAERFYRELKERGVSVRVGMEATGHARWFERLLAELGFELWIGDPAEIKTKRVRKQKTDREDARLMLKLLRENRFPDESGNFEVYVRPFPGPGGKWQISTGGGLSPRWSRNGRELFYSSEDSKIMVATYVVSGDSFHADKPRPWSPGQFSKARGYTSTFDLHPDGKRFAVLKASAASESTPGKATLILNFVDELRSKIRSQ